VGYENLRKTFYNFKKIQYLKNTFEIRKTYTLGSQNTLSMPLHASIYRKRKEHGLGVLPGTSHAPKMILKL
jgi:TRAP-type uncharacterized transport system substrate-binding protein